MPPISLLKWLFTVDVEMKGEIFRNDTNPLVSLPLDPMNPNIIHLVVFFLSKTIPFQKNQHPKPVHFVLFWINGTEILFLLICFHLYGIFISEK